MGFWRQWVKKQPVLVGIIDVSSAPPSANKWLPMNKINSDYQREQDWNKKRYQQHSVLTLSELFKLTLEIGNNNWTEFQATKYPLSGRTTTVRQSLNSNWDACSCKEQPESERDGVLPGLWSSSLRRRRRRQSWQNTNMTKGSLSILSSLSRSC